MIKKVVINNNEYLYVPKLVNIYLKFHPIFKWDCKWFLHKMQHADMT